MRTIWKYRLHTGHVAETDLNVPIGSKLLSIGWQEKAGLYVWFEVDREKIEEKEHRKFYTMHTGGDFDGNLQFIQTVVCRPTYVLHVYEEVKEKFLTDEDMRL